MDGPALRPHFTVPLAVSRDAAIEHVRARLNETVPDRWIGKGRWAEIHVPGDERRIWSPHLSLRLDRDEADAGRCTLFARFAPRPEIWTALVFLYAVLAFAGLFGAVFGYVQWASDEPAWGLWIPVVAIPGLLAIHGAGMLGRRLSRAQMTELHARLDPVIAGIRADRHGPDPGL